MKKILIIEDEKVISWELQTLLKNYGYDAMILNDFNDVKNKVLQMNPDLILLDINLPNLNGEIVLKEIRKESNVPVIMVTSRVRRGWWSAIYVIWCWWLCN